MKIVELSGLQVGNELLKRKYQNLLIQLEDFQYQLVLVNLLYKCRPYLKLVVHELSMMFVSLMSSDDVLKLTK